MRDTITINYYESLVAKILHIKLLKLQGETGRKTGNNLNLRA